MMLLLLRRQCFPSLHNIVQFNLAVGVKTENRNFKFVLSVHFKINVLHLLHSVKHLLILKA